MKVTVLAENTACRENVTAQHGLSLYLETEGKTILFDMGQDGTFLRNAESLGIDLSKVDMAVISHGHYDHGGGLEAFLQVNVKAPVYIHGLAFGDHFNGTEKYIGLNQKLREHPRLIFIKGSRHLSDNLQLTDGNDLGWNSHPWGLYRREEDVLLPDPFEHEQYLEVAEGEKRILISGCSHKGILNIAEYFQPDVLIGGFHLNKLEAPRELEAIANKLIAGNTLYYTGHCTGDWQYLRLKEIMGDRLQRLSTGLVFEL